MLSSLDRQLLWPAGLPRLCLPLRLANALAEESFPGILGVEETATAQGFVQAEGWTPACALSGLSAIHRAEGRHLETS